MPLLKPQVTASDIEQKANLRSSYQSYNGYRGDMEQSRQAATNEFESRITASKATMTSKGIKSGGNDWNNTLAAVQAKRDTDMKAIDDDFEKYKGGSEYRALLDDYESKIGTDLDKARSYNQNLVQMEMQGSALTPTFDEYVDSQFGDEQQQASVKKTMSMRRQNETRTTK